MINEGANHRPEIQKESTMTTTYQSIRGNVRDVRSFYRDHDTILLVILKTGTVRLFSDAGEPLFSGAHFATVHDAIDALTFNLEDAA